MTALKPHTLISSGVDWLTATAYRTRQNRPFYELGMSLLEDATKQGNDMQTWKAQGYRGLRSSGVRVGQRQDTFIVQLSSDEAHEHWSEVAALSTNVSRLDLEVTFEFDKAEAGFIQRQHKAARGASVGRGRKRNVTLITSTATGDSLYLGQRTSDVYARCYDKGMESKTAPRGKVVRHELELKRDLAKSALVELQSSDSADLKARSIVCSHMARQLLQTPEVERSNRESARARQPTDNDRRLRWLAASVKPSVEVLLQAGRLEDVLSSLGLTEAVADFCTLQRKRRGRSINGG